MAAQIDQQQLAQELVEQARAEGVELVGQGGLLTRLTKSVLETALEAEMTEHLGYDKHDPMGRNGAKSRNGTRTKTVLTEIGPVDIEVPRDRDGSFAPAIVRKRQHRLDGVDEIVLSLTARGLTTGEIAAHFAEVYGATVSRDTISRITDKVTRGDDRVAQPAAGSGLRLTGLFDPPVGEAFHPQRVWQMHPGTRGLQRIHRPVPAIRGFQHHLGSGPALASSRPNATGSLSMCTQSSCSPSGVIRTITTITLRRRCRSIPTYGRPS